MFVNYSCPNCGADMREEIFDDGNEGSYNVITCPICQYKYVDEYPNELSLEDVEE
jgi:DNA-directed RNA polymerase subunit RPC12/RpoP